LTIGGHIKAGTVLAWSFAVTKTACGVATPQLHIRFGTGATITDVLQCSFTGAAQSASPDKGLFTVQAVIRAVNSTGTVASVFVLDHPSGAAGFGGTATGEQVNTSTSTGFDLTTGTLIAGVSCNPGTSGTWTFVLVSVEAFNTI
jgi:hypothetical protein